MTLYHGHSREEAQFSFFLLIWFLPSHFILNIFLKESCIVNNLEIKPGLLVLTSSFFGNKICNVRFSFFFFFFNLTIAYVDWELESWIFLLKRKKSVPTPWYQQGDSQDVQCGLVIGLPIGIGFHLVFELSDKQIKKLTMWNFFYWTSLANNCSPFERKVLFKMLFSCFQLDFEITVTLEWIEWFKCYELFGSL